MSIQWVWLDLMGWFLPSFGETEEIKFIVGHDFTEDEAFIAY